MEQQRVFDGPGIVKTARVGIVTWTLIGLLLLGSFLLRYVFAPIRVLFPIVIMTTILVYILNPLVTRLERRGVRRGFGAAILYLAFFLVVGVALAFLVPIIVDQAKQLIVSLPTFARRSAEWIHRVLDRAGMDVSFSELLKQVQEGQSFAGGFIGRLTSIAGGVLELGLIMVLGPILAFYALVDYPKITSGIRAAIPPRRRTEWQPVLDQIGVAIGGFFRGQLLVAAFVGLASMVTLWIVGLPYWALVGIIAGIFNIVPMIGPYVAAAIAAVIALTAAPGSGAGLLDLGPAATALFAVLGLMIVQQLDNHVISPNVVARTVKLHPITVMLSLFTFGIFFGFWGLVLAVPAVATIKILVLHYWDTRATWPPQQPAYAAEDTPPEDIVVDPEVPPVVAKDPPLTRIRRKIKRRNPTS